MTSDPAGLDRDPALLVDLEALAIELATRAGALILDRPRPQQGYGVRTKSSDTDVVTVMDAASERFLHEQLRDQRPDDGVYGEEGARRPTETGLTWVVDPIDGTVNYLYGLSAYAVSVAVVSGDPATPGAWRPVAGAVCQPETGEVFHARRGGGAALTRADGAVRPLRVRPSTELSTALVATGFGYLAQDRAEQAGLLRSVLPRVRDIRRAGSAALDLCSVAAGRLDGYSESGLHPWDAAAGWLLVEEAGGVVTGWQGRPVASPGTVAGSGQVQRDLRELLERTLGGEVDDGVWGSPRDIVPGRASCRDGTDTGSGAPHDVTSPGG